MLSVIGVNIWTRHPPVRQQES